MYIFTNAIVFVEPVLVEYFMLLWHYYYQKHCR